MQRIWTMLIKLKPSKHCGTPLVYEQKWLAC
jgi:hypothetical protein